MGWTSDNSGSHLKGGTTRGSRSAWLGAANLTGVEMGNCEGLTQSQIDIAKTDTDHPPKLEGTVDANTGKSLGARGKATSSKQP